MSAVFAAPSSAGRRCPFSSTAPNASARELAPVRLTHCTSGENAWSRGKFSASHTSCDLGRASPCVWQGKPLTNLRCQVTIKLVHLFHQEDCTRYPDGGRAPTSAYT